MSYDTRAVDFFLGENTAFSQDESQEAEISFLLQHARPDDPRILTLLVERYGAEILRLVQALLDLPPGERAIQVAAQVYAAAGAGIKGFWGESGPRNWLFGLVINDYRKILRHPEKHPLPESPENPEFVSAGKAPDPSDELEASLWEAIDRLPERQRLVVVLRYLYGFSLNQIADLLKEKSSQIDVELFSARSSLHALLPAGDRLYLNVHPDRLIQIRDYRNGLLDHEAAVQTGLVQHVSECEHCFAYAEDLVKCEETLVSAVQNRWPQEPLEPALQSRLEEASRSILSQPQRRQYPALPIRQLLWSGGILLALAGLAWYLFQAGLVEEEKVFGPEPQSRPLVKRSSLPLTLPEPLEIKAANFSEAGEATSDGDVTSYIVHLEPVLSADGSKVAFSSTGKFLQESIRSDMMDVYLYDRSTGSVERAAPAGNRVGRWRSSPSVSENGRWTVYASNEIGSSWLETDPGIYDWSRTGIYLYDRETGERESIDIGVDGSTPDGDSYAPAISGDGRWVVYWSTSTNLVSEGEEACPLNRAQPQTCLDVFVHDRESSRTTRVPVGRLFDGSQFPSARLEISADGRWIPITILRTDRIAAEIGLANPAGAYLYDRQTGTFTQVDLSSEGVQGDALSYAASVSDDGRFVAFISRANNLVAGDDSRSKEIFVRDLVNGVTERVAGRGEGVLAFEYPGDSSVDLPGWGNTVGLSADGRYVTFLGSWEHAPDNDPEDCPSVMRLGLCNAVFLYDRETGKVEEVTLPGSNRLYLFPELSADGQWVTYVEMMANCDPFSDRSVCTEVWLYDREADWTYPVTKGRYSLPEATQLPVSNLSTGRGPVTSLAFSPDGELLATASRNEIIHLWWPANGSGRGNMKSSNGDAITGLVFSPDGNLLAAGLSSGRVDVWRLSDRFNLYTLDGHPGEILDLAFFDDGRLAVRTSRAIWLWEQQGDAFVRTKKWEYSPGTVWRMALSPGNDWIATAEVDDLVWLRQASSGEVLLRLKGRVEGLRRVSVSADGRYLAASWRGGLIDVWELGSSGKGMVSATYLRTLSQPEEILNLTFPSVGNYLATVSGSGELRMWNVETGISFRPFYPNSGLNGVLAFTKERMAAGVSTGLEQGEVYLAYLWEGFDSTDEPSFFEQGETDGDLPIGSLPAYRTREPGQGYTYIGKEIIFDDLYLANRATPFDIHSPTYLPPGFQFRLAQVYPTGAVSLYYDYFERPDSPPTASLLILQHPDTPGFPGYTVGASARIQDVEIGDLPGEYVRGQWQFFTFGQTDQGRFYLHWDSQSASQLMRWKDGEQLYAMHYTPLRAGGIEERYIGKADLIDIAERMAPLDRPNSPEYLLSASILRNQYGCLVSAARSGKSVSSRSMVGWDRSGECQLVFIDRNFQGQRLPFAGTDLNCDGGTERLEIQVVPGGRDSPPSYQLVLMAPSFTGRYQPAWRSSIPDPGLGMDLFAQVEVLPSSGCERTVALEVSSGGETFTRGYRWDGKDMQAFGESEGIFDLGHDALPP